MHNEKKITFDNELIVRILSAEKMKTRRKQSEILKMSLRVHDSFNIFDDSDNYIGLGKVTQIYTGTLLQLHSCGIGTQNGEGFLEFVNTFINHCGAVSIEDELVSLIEFKLIQNNKGQKLKLVNKDNHKHYEIQDT